MLDRHQTTTALSALLVVGTVAAPVFAQTDPSAFGTVFNIGDVPPGSIFDITSDDIPGVVVTDTQAGGGAGTLTPDFLNGDTLGSNSQLNLFNSGVILAGFMVGPGDASGSNIEVNIAGGSVNSINVNSGSTVNITDGSFRGITAGSGSTVNISGGNGGDYYFRAYSGSTVTISGGRLASGFRNDFGSTIHIVGGAFQLNGAAASDLSAGFGDFRSSNFNTDLLTGILADGSVFIFAGREQDYFAPDTTTLVNAPVAASTNPGTLASGTFSKGLRPGENLTVTNAGRLGNYFSIVGGTLNHNADEEVNGLRVISGEVNISAGNFVDFYAFSGSTVNISGGYLESEFEVTPGSTVTISGGSIGQQFRAGPGSTVSITGGTFGNLFSTGGNGGPDNTLNISGGSFGFGFDVYRGATVSISGGSFGNSFTVSKVSTVNISGGTFGDGFEALASATETSDVTFTGGAFQLNGAAVSDLSAGFGGTLEEPNTDLFTGILADGNVFIFAAQEGDRFAPGTTTLVNTPVPASSNPGILESGTFSKGLRPGESLTVTGTGRLGDNFAVVSSTLNYDADTPVTGLEVVSGEVNISAGSFVDFVAFSNTTVNLSGGSIGSSFQANPGNTINISGGDVGDDFSANSGSTVNITGGTIGPFSRANSGGTVNISGGSIDYFFDAQSGSVINISGGNVGSSFDAFSGSIVNITGGSIDRNFAARSDSRVNISGGTIGRSFYADSGSTVTITGSAFQLNGVVISDLSAGFGGNPNTELLTAILADGSVVIFAGEMNDYFAPGTTTLVNAPVAASTNPGTLDNGMFSKGLRPGEILTVIGTGRLGDNFAVVGGTLNYETDSQAIGLEVVSGEVNIYAGSLINFGVYSGSVVNLSGGGIGQGFLASSGSTVNISGGTVDRDFRANLGSTVNIFGGTVGDSFIASSGSTVNIAAGGVGNSFTANSNSTVNISGGSFGDSFAAASGSTVNITGGSFGTYFRALSGSTVNISGGTFDTSPTNSRLPSFNVDSGSTVNLFGTAFFLDGVELTDLVFGEAFTIADRDIALTGELVDGTELDFFLGTSTRGSSQFFSPGATLTITLVPEPMSLSLLALGLSFTTHRRRPHN